SPTHLPSFPTRRSSDPFAPTDSQMVHLLRMADEHARRLMVDRYISIGNHGFFQVAGLNLLCSVISERSSCRGAREFAKRKLDERSEEHTSELQSRENLV